ncbi:MAG: hypothetical protein ACRC51_07980 [Cetobacterium sp.]
MKKFSCDCFVTHYLNLPQIEAENEEEARKIFEEMIKNQEWDCCTDLDFNGEFKLTYICEK